MLECAKHPLGSQAVALVFGPFVCRGMAREVNRNDILGFKHLPAVWRQVVPTQKIQLPCVLAEIVTDPTVPIQKVRIIA